MKRWHDIAGHGTQGDWTTPQTTERDACHPDVVLSGLDPVLARVMTRMAQFDVGGPAIEQASSWMKRKRWQKERTESNEHSAPS
jgi:hypothetical protein